MSVAPDALVLTAAEAAETLRISKSHLSRLVHSGQLRALANVGRRTLIPRAELERFITEMGQA